MFTPVLIYLVFGLVEMGMFFRTYISISAALADGSRQGSILGDQLDVDYQLIKAVERGLASVPTSDIRVLVIFDAKAANAANPANAAPPEACAQTGTSAPVSTTSVTDECNAYTPGTDWKRPDTEKHLYGCRVISGTEGDRSIGWCPRDRKNAATDATGHGPPDYLGIYIRVEHKFITGFFGKTKTAEQTFITRLEPQSMS